MQNAEFPKVSYTHDRFTNPVTDGTRTCLPLGPDLGAAPTARRPEHDPHRQDHLALCGLHIVLAVILLAEGVHQIPHALCMAGAAGVYLRLFRGHPDR